MYHIIISILTCRILGIPMPSIDFLREAYGRRDCTIQMETDVAIETIDQLSIYTCVCSCCKLNVCKFTGLQVQFAVGE